MNKLFRKVLNSGMGYLPFKIIEGVFGILSLSLYTYLLTTTTYGQYGVVNTTMMVVYLLTIGWFMFVANRYVKEQKTDEDKRIFYSNLLGLQGLVFAGLFLVYIVFSLIMVKVFEYDVKLLLVYVLFFAGYMMTQFYTHMLLYVDRRLMNVILVVLSAVAKPCLVYLLYRAGVETLYILFIGHGLVDLLMGSIAFGAIGPYRFFDAGLVKIAKFKEFFAYGFPLIGLTLTMYILNISDRYIIKGFYSDHEVGLYTSNYSLASAAFLMISYGLSRGFYPRLLAAWKDNRKAEAEGILGSGIKNYLFLALPAATGMYILSDNIGRAFIADKFSGGYPVIGLVAIGMFFLGLAEYANKGWELKGNTKPIFRNSLLAAVVNLVLNFAFVPRFGFIAAALTTALSFGVYFAVCFVNRMKEVQVKLNVREIASIILADIVMAVVVYLAGGLKLPPMALVISQVAVGGVSYMILIGLLRVYDIKEFINRES